MDFPMTAGWEMEGIGYVSKGTVKMKQKDTALDGGHRIRIQSSECLCIDTIRFFIAIFVWTRRLDFELRCVRE